MMSCGQLYLFNRDEISSRNTLQNGQEINVILKKETCSLGIAEWLEEQTRIQTKKLPGFACVKLDICTLSD
jgi:hypothetical protein